MLSSLFAISSYPAPKTPSTQPDYAYGDIHQKPGTGGINKPAIYSKHDGGLVEEHHNGDFAGNLKSNEVFSKLLKGEYVATEYQMNNFLKNILPRFMSPSISSTNQSVGNITVTMPITVQGNMDSSVIPDMDKIADKVITQINKAITPQIKH